MKQIKIKIHYYKDNNGNKVYDCEAIAEEFENKLSEIMGVTVMCSILKDK